MKRTILLLTAALMIIILCACGSSNDNTPAGIVHHGTVDCYIFMLPAGKTVNDYFQTEGPVNTIAGTAPDGGSLGGAKYQAESRGGYVAYTGNLVGYVPPGGTENDASSLCSDMLFGKRNEYMTFNEACKYLPWLAK